MILWYVLSILHLFDFPIVIVHMLNHYYIKGRSSVAYCSESQNEDRFYK